VFGNKHASIGDDDIANSITLTGQAVGHQAALIANTYVKDKIIENSITSPHLMNYSESIVAGDTDSIFFTAVHLFKALNLKFTENGELTEEALFYAKDLETHLNIEIKKWGKAVLNSADCRIVFKREKIADVGLFLEKKKRYVLHLLDDEGFKVNKFKYVGVDVIKTAMPKAVKPHLKRVIEIMITTQNLAKTNDALLKAYNIFKALPDDDISRVSGINDLEKHSLRCVELTTTKGMPIHVKAAYFYNLFIDKLGLANKYEKIVSGDKLRYFYVQQPNKYGIKVMGYKYDYPDEFRTLFKPDTELMFNKIIFSAIERFYNAVNWVPRKPGEQIKTDLIDLFT